MAIEIVLAVAYIGSILGTITTIIVFEYKICKKDKNEN